MRKGSAISYLVHLCHATNMESHNIVDDDRGGFPKFEALLISLECLL